MYDFESYDIIFFSFEILSKRTPLLLFFKKRFTEKRRFWVRKLLSEI